MMGQKIVPWPRFLQIFGPPIQGANFNAINHGDYVIFIKPLKKKQQKCSWEKPLVIKHAGKCSIYFDPPFISKEFSIAMLGLRVDPWHSTIGLGQGWGVKAIPPNPESQDHHSTWFFIGPINMIIYIYIYIPMNWMMWIEHFQIFSGTPPILLKDI